MAPHVRVSARTLVKDYRRVFKDLSPLGDLVWVDTGHQRFLLVNSAEHVKEMLIDGAEQLVKPDSQTIETGRPASASADEGIPVPEFRAALTKGMGAGRVPDVLASIASAASAEMVDWHDGMRFPLMARMRRLAVAVTCWASFGSSLSDDELARAERAMRWAGRSLQVRSTSSVRWDRLKLNRWRRRTAFKEMKTLSRRLIANADMSRPTELTAAVNDLPKLAPALAIDRIESMVAELFFGAADPLTQSSAWTLVRFASEREAAQRLRTEWDDALPAGGAVDPQMLSRLRYTDAFVHEVMRLHPTNDRITRHVVAEANLGGEALPPLTRVILNVHALHRDPRYYDDPERFAPERWLEGRPNRHKFAYISFGVGGRRCLGETMALTALVGLLPVLGRDWDVSFDRLRLSSGPRHQPAESVQGTLHARSDFSRTR
jgi:cytochrome P450